TYKVNNKAIMITQDIGEKSNIEPKISDLGLSSRIDEINVDGTKELNDDELKIKNAFLKADKMIVSQLEALQRHPD
ncbi:24593_t:CDS:2, partial [Racocetra persica]